MKTQTGFTLIELTATVIIVSILAAFAVPKLVNLRGNAYQASINGMAGAFGTAASVNAAACTATGNVATTGAAITVSKCSSVASLIFPPVVLGTAGAAIANTYNLAADTAVTDGVQATCTLQYLSGSTTYTAAYVVIGAC